MTLAERVAQIRYLVPGADAKICWLRKLYSDERIKKKKLMIKKVACAASESMESDNLRELVPKLLSY